MPSANPMAPVIEIGGGANVGPASASGNASLGVQNMGDNHAAAGWLLLALLLLVALHRARFRFSQSVG